MAETKYQIATVKDIGDISVDGIFVYSLHENKVTYCNHMLSEIFGTTMENIIDRPIEVLKEALNYDDHYLEGILQQLQAKYTLSNVQMLINASGKSKYLTADIYYIEDSGVVMSIIKDITTLKEHENYIVDFGARKDTLLDMIAHNLSGPLNLTANLLNLVDEMNKVEKYKKIDNHTRLIRENTQQCIEIINTFLKEEHLESERVFVKANRFNTLEKIKIVIANMRDFNPEKDFRLIAEKDELYISGDDVKFFQIVHNLFSNACKFTHANGIIECEVKDMDHSFSVRISDNGIGIPEHMVPYIFTKNTPASRTGLKGEKSIGMGLYIIKKLVELMKGTITFQSEENKGTTFLLTFPKENF
jgi:two-component system sensor histidine kinase VicK